MLEELKEQVCHANLELKNSGVVIYTWGNVSGIDRERELVVIKPSGVKYDIMCPKDMVVVDLYTGKVVEGNLKPSSDTPTHLEIYKSFEKIGGITHTHSVNATSFAQAGMDIPALGTTHADYFYGDVLCTRDLTEEEVNNEYEKHTGDVIVETIIKSKVDPMAVPGILVKNHGPFTWGLNADASVYHAVVLEYIAEMAIKTKMLNKNSSMAGYVSDKHYRRKHGKDAYYGQ
ncbi:MAG: L-ribulose-5-phosphate 4-epimerase [Lachnospiraceae bacterium]|nr:L-ribulose-5-phosphate 4-epimerase [Lachnospiraceae bacterium]